MAVVKLLGLIGLTLPLMPAQQVLLWLWPKAAVILPHIFHRAVCRLLGLRLTVEGHALSAGPCLIVSNHVSWLDILVLSAVCPLAFVAKHEVSRWPLFGSLARLQRTLFVERERRHKAGEQRDNLQSRLATGETLVLFPEGTSGDGLHVLPFKSSFFAVAENSATSIHPVSLVYLRQWGLKLNRRQRPGFAWYGDMDLVSHLWGVLRGGPLEVVVMVHPPLSPESKLSRKQAARVAEATVRHGLVGTLHAATDLR